MEFGYDGSGNRVFKSVKTKSGSIDNTYYLYDVGGNALSIYETTSGATATLAEQFIYGSSRIGTFKSSTTGVNSHLVGLKEYELKDHLTNVRVVLSDKLNGDVISATDYLPFGMLARGYSPTYRYGFNGKEKVDEISGDGNAYDFGDRMYDPRIGRFASIDRRTKEFPGWSPYVFAINNPIKFIDVNGEGPGDGTVRTFIVQVQVQTANGIATAYLAKKYYENISPALAQSYQEHALTPNGWYIVDVNNFKAAQSNPNQGFLHAQVPGANTPEKKIGGLFYLGASEFLPMNGASDQGINKTGEGREVADGTPLSVGTIKFTQGDEDGLFELMKINAETGKEEVVFSQNVKAGESAYYDFNIDAQNEHFKWNIESNNATSLSVISKAVTGNAQASDTMGNYGTEQPQQQDLNAVGAKLDTQNK